jgi:hypothetical protein
MKVKELIEQLKKLNEDAEVVITYNDTYTDTVENCYEIHVEDKNNDYIEVIISNY